jgi:hypothetical protein
VVTCISSAREANGDSIVWTNETGLILASTSSATQLELNFDFANSSHRGVINCTLHGRGGAQVVRTLSVFPGGKKMSDTRHDRSVV